MGYRGKIAEREQARALRARSMTVLDIAKQLGVSKSSVSVWVRDVVFVPSVRRTGPRLRPHPQQVAKQQEIEYCKDWAEEKLRTLSDDQFFVAGIALYAGEGAKTQNAVKLANTDPRIVRFFCNWLRMFFDCDEAKFRLSVYLHEGLDIDAAHRHWCQITRIDASLLRKPYRAVAREGFRNSKHPYGCAYVTYHSALLHRKILALCDALLSYGGFPG